MSTQLMTQADITELVTLDVTEAKKTVAQMTSIMNMIASEKDMSDSKLSMMEKQKWYKKMWFTITGKNKGTVKEISQHKDQIAAYTSQAVAVLYENSKVEQMQIVSLGNSVNYLGSQLVATNYALLQTQEAVAQFKSDIIKTIGSLANALDEKIKSVDNFHIIAKEIEQGKYDFNNPMTSLMCVISQIDRHMISDIRKMDILKNALIQRGIISDSEKTLTEIMDMFAKISDDYLGIVYSELSCYNGNEYSDIFAECMECYSMLPKMDKKAKKPDGIIVDILNAKRMNGNTNFSTSELYDFFVNSKMDFFCEIHELSLPALGETDNKMETAEERALVNTALEVESLSADNIVQETENIPENIEFEEEQDDEPIPDELTDIRITRIMSISSGSEKIFRYNTVYVDSFINCDGNLIFDHCRIVYNENGFYGIKMGDGSSLGINNCEVICKGYSLEDDSDNAFITVGNDCHVEYIHFRKTIFRDCTHFLYTTRYHSQKAATLDFDDCEIVNCYFGFVNSDNQLGTMNNCRILFNGLPHYTRKIEEKALELQKEDNWRFYEYTSGTNILEKICRDNRAFIDAGFNLYNCVIEQTENIQIFRMDGDKRENRYFGRKLIKVGNCYHCTFKGIKDEIYADSILNCMFDSCSSIVYIEKQAVDCVFSGESPCLTLNKAKAEYCQFIDCKKTIIMSTSIGSNDITSCEFYNLSQKQASYGGMIYLGRSGDSDCKANTITRCLFNGVLLNNDYLIASNKHCGKPKGYIIQIEQCTFKNCQTQRSDKTIIRRGADYIGAFDKEKYFESGTYISNCSGLDNINKEGNKCSDILVNTVGSNGETIGADMNVLSDDVGIGDLGYCGDLSVSSIQSNSVPSNDSINGIIKKHCEHISQIEVCLHLLNSVEIKAKSLYYFKDTKYPAEVQKMLSDKFKPQTLDAEIISIFISDEAVVIFCENKFYYITDTMNQHMIHYDSITNISLSSRYLIIRTSKPTAIGANSSPNSMSGSFSLMIDNKYFDTASLREMFDDVVNFITNNR